MFTPCKARTSSRLGASAPVLLATLALGGFATPSATSVPVEPAVVLAASTHSVSPAGWCAFGHNPDGSCRGHRVSDGAKSAGRRCVKYGKAGARNEEYGKDGAMVWGAIGEAGGGTAMDKGGESGTAIGAAGGKAAGEGAGKYIGKGAGAVVNCVLYASDSNWDK